MSVDDSTHQGFRTYKIVEAEEQLEVGLTLLSSLESIADLFWDVGIWVCNVQNKGIDSLIGSKLDIPGPSVDRVSGCISDNDMCKNILLSC